MRVNHSTSRRRQPLARPAELTFRRSRHCELDRRVFERNLRGRSVGAGKRPAAANPPQLELRAGMPRVGPIPVAIDPSEPDPFTVAIVALGNEGREADAGTAPVPLPA